MVTISLPLLFRGVPFKLVFELFKLPDFLRLLLLLLLLLLFCDKLLSFLLAQRVALLAC